MLKGAAEEDDDAVVPHLEEREHVVEEEDDDSSATSSDEETTRRTFPARARLGRCQTCRQLPAKYTCPRCSTHSCSAPCVQAHKEKSGCSGHRDRTKYVSLAAFTQLDMLSDYRMLEEVNRAKENMERMARDAPALHPKERFFFMPRERRSLAMAVRNARRNVRLLFLPGDLERSLANTSSFDVARRRVLWKLELVFPHSRKVVVHKSLDEMTKLHAVLKTYIQPGRAMENEDVLANDPFAEYRSAGWGGVRVLLKGEHAKQRFHAGQWTATRFHELNVKKSLRGNLRGQTVVEHPVIFVTLAAHAHFFPDEPVHIKLHEGQEVTKKVKKEENEWDEYEKTEASMDDDVGAKTFGLFAAGHDQDVEEELDALEDDSMKRLAQDKAARKRRESERDELSKAVEKRQRVWRQADQLHEEESFVRAFAVQDDEKRDPGVGREVQAEGEVQYDQFYDFYLKYYQRKYGVTEKAAEKTSAGGLSSLADYGDSEEDE